MTPPGSRRRVVVVAGMHRAGTSVVARALSALGIDLGERLMSADVRMNARGFFEDLDVVELDDALLRLLGADWKSVALLHDTDFTAAAFAALRQDAVDLLETRLERSSVFAFKDPRVARLLPLWQQAFQALAVDDAYVIAVRHPLAVVDSLAARDDLDARRSTWLWLTHWMSALRYTTGRTRVVVDYDRLVDAPERELSRMARALGLAPCGPAELASFTGDFLSGELRHSRHDELALGSLAAAPLVAEAYLLARRLATDDLAPDAHDTIAQTAGLFARLESCAPLLAYAGDLERVADDSPRLQGELAWARDSLAQATAYAAELQAALQTAQAYSVDLKSHLDRKEAELIAAHDKLERVRQRYMGRIVLRGIESQ